MKKLIYILFPCIFIACKKDNQCFSGPGKESVINEELGEFNSLTINNFMDVYWKQDIENSIQIVGGDNYINQLTCNISQGHLELKNTVNCKFLKKETDRIKITITSPSLDSVTFKGTGLFETLDTIKNYIYIASIANQGSIKLITNNNRVKFYLESGSTDLSLKGKTQYADYYNSGFNHFYAKTWEVDSFRLHSRANGITQIKAKEWLHIEQNGDGDIEYWGNPSFIEVTSYLGNGAIIKK